MLAMARPVGGVVALVTFSVVSDTNVLAGGAGGWIRQLSVCLLLLVSLLLDDLAGEHFGRNLRLSGTLALRARFG